MSPAFTPRLHPIRGSSWLSLLLRILATAALFAPWDYRFEAVSFRLEDLDPALVQAAQAQGWNLVDPAIWPTASGTLARLGVLALVLGSLWCGVALVRRRVQGRFGAGWAFLGLVPSVLVFFVSARLIVSRFFPDFSNFIGNGYPVWGGWVHSGALGGEGVYIRTVILVLAILAVEGALMGLAAQRGLREARETALRSKLAPHFLFNALNTLHAQIDKDPQGAQATTERLAKLFRQVLEVTEAPTISLGRELAFVEDYLGIEQVRLGERLKVRIEVPEELLSCPIPVFALQVLAENAVKHGIAPREDGGELRITAHQKGRRLIIAVEDPGNGSTEGTSGSGTALANLRRRLANPRDLTMEPTALGHRVSFAWTQP